MIPAHAGTRLTPRARMSALLAAIALGAAVATSCRSGGNASNPMLGPQADSLLACAERELFARGYRVTRVAGSRPHLRAEPQPTANTARPQTIMVEYDPDRHGLDVWAPAPPGTPEAMASSPEVDQLARTLADACTATEAKREP